MRINLLNNKGGLVFLKFCMNETINTTLQDMVSKIEKYFNADLITIHGPISMGLVSLVNKLIEDFIDDGNKHDKLVIMLTTTGGIAEEVERIVNVIRHFYQEVIFVVPDYAYSAGTIFCMSGDEIYMDYFSVLGPIDPQLYKDDKYVPALGYLDKVKEFVDKSKDGVIAPAEIMMLQEIDLADLRSYEQARDLAIDLLKKWLVQFKFKNWDIHMSSGQPVTWKDKEKRAEEIATILSDNKEWMSHGRGIDINVLRSKLRLKINDFCDDKDLSYLLRSYHELLEEYNETKNMSAFIYTRRSA